MNKNIEKEIFEELDKKIAKYENTKKYKTEFHKIEKGKADINWIREFFDIKGEEFEMDNNICVGRIDAGVKNKNYAIAAVTYDEKMFYVAVCAREGIIKQHTAEEAFAKMKDYLLKD